MKKRDACIENLILYKPDYRTEDSNKKEMLLNNQKGGILSRADRRPEIHCTLFIFLIFSTRYLEKNIIIRKTMNILQRKNRFLDLIRERKLKASDFM